MTSSSTTHSRKHVSYDLPVLSTHNGQDNGVVNKSFQADVPASVSDNNQAREPSNEETAGEVQKEKEVSKQGVISKDDKDDEDTYCGFGSWRPACMQGCKNMACFSALYCVIGLVMSALNSYINSQITTLEKHFNLSSAISGFLMSCNDFGYLSTTLFMSYYTRRVHIPRALAISSVLYGASGLVCTVAFFGTRSQIPSPPTDIVYGINTSQKPARLTGFTQMCQNTTTPANHSCAAVSSRSKGVFEITDDWRVVAICIIAIGMIIQGVAKSPRQSFLTTYVDDNVPKTKTAMYLGLTIGMSIFGPGIAFALGGVFSSMYVTLEETSISPRDPRWLGAWWLGFLVFGGAGLVVALPLVFFPMRMRRERKPPATVQVPKVENTRLYGFWVDTKDLLKSVVHLLANPVFMCLTFANVFNVLGVSGIMSFFGKYLETQFTIPAAKANMLIGAVTFTAAPLGTIVGGFVTSRLKLSPKTCLKVAVICSLINNAVSCLNFVFGCDQPAVNIGAHTDSLGYQTRSPCLQDCHCDEQKYFPICGSDGISYFSPCHAGCVSMNNQIFTNCSCLSSTSSQTATGGLCQQDCGMLYPYMSMSFLGAFTSTLSLMPAFIATIRSVKEENKPLAIGFSAFLCNLFGWFPGPVLYGALVDSTCKLWRSTCSTVGACSLYDIELFRFRFVTLSVGLRTIVILLYVIALLYVHCSRRNVFQPHLDNISETVSADEKENGNNVNKV
ncbi:hypothetical protein BsWGS_24281 [Bradybaena similaris]